MAFFPGGPFDSSADNSGSWLKRVSENLQQVLHTGGICPTAANGAPLHFEPVDLSARRGKAQTFSASVHAVVVAALLILAFVSPPVHRSPGPTIPLDSGKNLLPYLPRTVLPPSQESSAGHGAGGEDELLPARKGNLAPESSMPLAPPRLIHSENVALPAPPAVFDPNAPASVPTVTNLGLPWMDKDTDSAGPGRRHGFGSGNGDTMGDGNRNGAGEGDSEGPYVNAVWPVTCVYCPEPGYTEEARKAKLQGKMLLRVLVGPDGKAQKIEILQRLGMGLDERAEETVRSWRFSPGRDAAKRPVSAWVTIETRFQLF
jgi:TonB family protein